jgi:hypothetical protein
MSRLLDYGILGPKFGRCGGRPVVIQGIVILSDASRGIPLPKMALLDPGKVTQG